MRLKRFAPLAEETRLSALTSFMSFRRHPNERINELLTRFETVSQTAYQEANFTMNFEGLSYILLKTVGVTEHQLLPLLQPTGGQFPIDQGQYLVLQRALRSMGHILEHSPGNIAQSLRGQGGSHTRPLMVYHTTDGMGEDGRSSSASQWNGHDWTGDDEHQSYLNRERNQRWEAHDQEVHWDRADSISGLDDSDTSTETSSGDYNDDLPPDPETDALPAWQRGPGAAARTNRTGIFTDYQLGWGKSSA